MKIWERPRRGEPPVTDSPDLDPHVANSSSQRGSSTKRRASFDPLATPDFFPMQIDAQRNSILFVQMSRQSFKQSVFLDRRAVLAGRTTLSAKIPTLIGRQPQRPMHFILHGAFCGSTLLARYLETLPDCLVLKEPSVLFQLSRLHDNSPTEVESSPWHDRLRVTLALLARGYPTDRAVIVKANDRCSWMGNLLLDHDAGTKIIFVSAPLKVFLLQVLKEEERRQFVQARVEQLAGAMAQVPFLSGIGIPDLTDGQRAAALWLLNRRLGRFDEALRDFETAVALLPDHAGLHSNRGNALLALSRFEDAIESYDTAIALSPHYPDVYDNRGVALKELKRFDEAMESFSKALALKPDHHEAIFNRALLNLLMGRFEIGWRDYEARKNTREPTANRSWGKPLWLGETDISGKTILVDWEQGFGDVIQMSRYIRLLEDAGASVLFLPQKKLRTLMRGLNADACIIDHETVIPEFDLHCPLISLPLAFKTNITSIPSSSYITADEEKVAVWRHRLGRKTKLRVGVVLKGNVFPGKDRSIDLERFQRLFNPYLEFISLQKEVTDAERSLLDRAGVLNAGDAFDDFSDTAAVCILMDLVISIDTSVAHLAGALGVPVWVLINWAPDWRWLLDRDDSPWYPSMRLFRQKARGDWDGVLERLELELKAPIPPGRSV